MIFIDNRQNIIDVTEEMQKKICDTIEYSLKEEKVNVDYEISLIFVDNEEIRNLNKQHRNIDKSTDVLSFPMLDYTDGKVYKEMYENFKFDETYLDNNYLVLGDIVLSLERAKEQSEEYEHSFIREVCYLSVHSILHLLGYDHMAEDDKIKMRKREEEILEKLNIMR